MGDKISNTSEFGNRDWGGNKKIQNSKNLYFISLFDTFFLFFIKFMKIHQIFNEITNW